MKRICIISGCCLLAILAIIFYQSHKIQYLNLAYVRLSGERADVCEMKVTSGITLKGYEGVDTFTDKQIINKVMDYLNSIPLVSSSKANIPGDYPDDSYGVSGTIFFYDENGIEHDVRIIDDRYMINSVNLKVYKTRDEETRIISDLEELEFD